MEINITGKLYIYFIKSIFESNKKTGIEIIFDINKSDYTLINGLRRMNLLNNNKIKFLNNNYPSNINIFAKKCMCEINITLSNNIAKINTLNVIKFDEGFKYNSEISVNKYMTNKNKIVFDIMEILKNTQ